MKEHKEAISIRRNCIYHASVSERCYGHPSITDYEEKNKIFKISKVCYRPGWFKSFEDCNCNSITINTIIPNGMNAIITDLFDFRKLSIRDKASRKKT